MTQKHISHPEGLPSCKEGHSARHIRDERCASAGGGHFVECRCRHTSKHTELEAALAEWRRINRPARSARKQSAASAPGDDVLQLPLRLVEGDTKRQHVAGGAHGRR